ncbi:MAG: tetratricopeptide repeat protein [Candidatus Eremiobacteraeota bacterium]|nr:tetratricopeptide repeat protein [Candidatus Eremiobacteraeota bacterium]
MKNLTSFEENLKSGKFKQAREFIDGEIARNPLKSKNYTTKGILCETMGRLKEAIEYFRKAHKLDPDDPENVYWISEINLMKYDIPATLETCREGEKKFPDDPRFLMVKADTYQWDISVSNLSGEDRENALKKSRDILDKYIEMNPDDGEIKVVEATWFLQKGDLEKSLECFKEALKLGLVLYGDYIDVGLCLAILYLRKGDKATARSYIERSLNLFEKWNEPHYLKLFLHYEHLLMLLDAYFDEKLTGEKIEPFYREYLDLMERGVKVHPVTRDFREIIKDFIISREEGDYERARSALRKALGILEGEPPLCIIFRSIKLPALKEIFGYYLEELGN